MQHGCNIEGLSGSARHQSELESLEEGPRDAVSWPRRNRSYPPFDEACELRDNRVQHAFPSQSACYVAIN